MDNKTLVFGALVFISVVSLLLGNYYLKIDPVRAMVLGFIAFSIGMGLSLLLIYEVFEFVVHRRPFDAILLIFPVIAAFGYSLAKMSVTGVALEVMGAKGPTAAVLRIVQVLTGQYGTPLEVFGVWLGFITMGASIAIIIYAILEALTERLEYEKAVTVSILGGFGIASGFVTGHLAMTSFLYPFFSLAGTPVYIPVFAIALTIGLLAILGGIYLLLSK